MEAQETKFSFVYHEVKQRILTNQIPPGDYMPSSRILCHQFNVSRYTINRVFEALQKEGYIEIKPRIAPIVLPREAVIQQENEGIDILRSRDNILQLYQTFALILPSLLSFAAKHCNLEILYHYKKAIPYGNFRRRVASCIKSVKRNSDNWRKSLAGEPLFCL